VVLLDPRLGRLNAVLQAAAAAMVREDARRTLTVRAGLQHRQQIGLQVPLGQAPHPCLNALARQGPRDEHHLVLPTAHTLPVMAAAIDAQLEPLTQVGSGLHHRRDIRDCFDPIGA
jgi:hypothetical protein